eukprot:scaffold14894_cov74-Phaeocystis_antarctica.AAC.1
MEECVDGAQVDLVCLDEHCSDIELVEGHAAQHVRLRALDVDREQVDGSAAQVEASQRLRHADALHLFAAAIAPPPAHTKVPIRSGSRDVGGLAQHVAWHERARAIAADRRVESFLWLEADAPPAEAQVEEGRIGDPQRIVGADVEVEAVRLAGEEVAVEDPVLPRLREAAAIEAAQHSLASVPVRFGRASEQWVNHSGAAEALPRAIAHWLQRVSVAPRDWR